MPTFAATSVLSRRAREETIEALARSPFDIVVIGGGVTGAGAALDGATRGLRVALVEMGDYAAGTSSRSGKLIHGALEVDLTRDDIDGVFAGLPPLVRPLVRPVVPPVARPAPTARDCATSRLGREHALASPVPGFTTIAGGKYTTCRVMAEQVVDLAAAGLGRRIPASTTENVPLLGAVGLESARQQFRGSADALGLSQQQIEHLLGRYGSLVLELDAHLRTRPELAQPIAGAQDYLQVEALYAVTHEGALHLDDVLTRRMHIGIETKDRGLSAAPVIAPLIAAELRWDDDRVAEEIRRYRALVESEIGSDISVDLEPSR